VGFLVNLQAGHQDRPPWCRSAQGVTPNRIHRSGHFHPGRSTLPATVVSPSVFSSMIE
jgi:hypothetical protein